MGDGGVEGGQAGAPDEVTHTHGGGGGEQVARSIVLRKYRLKDGIKRDNLLQLDMRNYTKHFENSGRWDEFGWG